MTLLTGPRPVAWPRSGASWRAEMPATESAAEEPEAVNTTNDKTGRAMAELTIRPEEIRDALSRFVQEYEPAGAAREEVGTVIEAGDGIARVEGLPSAMASELLVFENGVRGLALNLDVREIGVVILGEFNQIEEGQQVKRTGEILSVPVGDAFLGRVVGPLGEPLDGKGPIDSHELRLLETQAPSVVERQPVKEPLQTGIKAIDAMTAIGRGQRELIIGDRQTGKTAICIDTIINQRANWASGDDKQRVRCVYVAVGQKGSTIAQVRQSLEDAGALEYTTIVAAPASDPAGYKYIAPYTGPAVGPRGLPGRRVLPALPAARAVRQAVRRPRRRLADRAADRRDQGQRHLRLHPDQRHLDHRRADLPRGRPVQRRRPARHQRRPVGVQGRRQRAGQGHEDGRGQPAAFAVPVPRPGGVRRLRLRPGRGLPGPAGPRLAAGRAAQAAAVRPVPGRERSGLDLGGQQRLPGRRAAGGRQPVRARLPGEPAALARGNPDHDQGDEGAVRGYDHRAQGRGRGVPQVVRDQLG